MVEHPVLPFSPSNACFNWCQQSIQDHASNVEISGLFILVAALFALVIANIFWTFNERMQNKGMSEEQITMAIIAMLRLAFLLVVGFFVWYAIRG